MMRIALGANGPIRLDYTLDTGQVFRWRQEADGRWYGALRGTALALRVVPGALEVETAGAPLPEAALRRFLGLDDPLPAIRAHLSRDPVLRRAFAGCYGLRVVQQDPWEGLVSFICSSHNAIFRIQQMTGCLARLFGQRYQLGGVTVETFPAPEVIAGLSLAELAPCRLGYRDAYVLEAARLVASGAIDLGSLVDAPYPVAREVLLRVPGVGPKVADCVLLLALGKKECGFPIDVWVRRGVLRHYREAIRAATGVTLRAEDGGLTDREYRATVRWAQQAFAPYVGYAQAYLFLATRSGLL
jgi:N-glycosylase/DNA lyase